MAKQPYSELFVPSAATQFAVARPATEAAVRQHFSHGFVPDQATRSCWRVHSWQSVAMSPGLFGVHPDVLPLEGAQATSSPSAPCPMLGVCLSPPNGVPGAGIACEHEATAGDRLVVKVCALSSCPRAPRIPIEP